MVGFWLDGERDGFALALDEFSLCESSDDGGGG